METDSTGSQECWTVRELARQAGLSTQRLYQIWEKGGDVPPRIVIRRPGRRWGRVCIPKREGTAWINRRYGGLAI